MTLRESTSLVPISNGGRRRQRLSVLGTDSAEPISAYIDKITAQGLVRSLEVDPQDG